jgi:FKBP-type peptidyl-prolyl cis-trans isomerase
MRPLTAAAALCLAALTITACGGSSAGAAGARADVPVVTGAFGSDPLISLPAVKPPGTLVVRTLWHGSGAVVKSHSFVMFNVEGKVWAGDRLVIDSYTNRKPQGLPLGAGLPAWQHLAGQRVGSRVLMVVPPTDGFGPHGNSSINVTGTDTLVFVFDILSAVPAGGHASGTVLPYRAAPGMPQVTTSVPGPQITVPKHTPPPSHLVTRLLVRGAGPAVAADDTVVTQYTGAVWRDGKVFSSSWAQGSPQAFELGQGQVIRGWQRGLTGVPVGSRVLMVIPPSLGYGKAGNPPLVKAKDTLVYVVDILAAIPS